MDTFPELLLIDATYKLNDLRMPLYVLLVVDGNGESEVAALFFVQDEERDTIREMIVCFKQHNPKWEKIEVIMGDKDFTERDVLLEEIPQAALVICLFHALRSFNREIKAEKLGITSDERELCLELFRDMCYASNLTKYQESYEKLNATRILSVINYFNKNWHPIKNEWVQGLKQQYPLFGNNTNNRLESFNQKIKQVVEKNSGLVVCFLGLIKCLRSSRIERDHRAILTAQKVSINMYGSNTPEGKYQKLLTPFAFNFLLQQLKLTPKVDIDSAVKKGMSYEIKTTDGMTTTSRESCSCTFFTSMRLPCRHMFSLRSCK